MSAINNPHPKTVAEAISDLRYIALEDYIAPHWSERLEKIAAMLERITSDDLSWLREEGKQEGAYESAIAVRAEVLRELLEWEANYMQQARGGDQSGKSDARADAAREIHDHLHSSWDTRDKLSEHWSDCATSNGPAYPVGPCDCGAVK